MPTRPTTSRGKQEPGFPPFGSPRRPEAPLIPALERGLLLHMPQIDSLHQEFADMVNALGHARKPEFCRIFNELVNHTEAHFAYENKLMAKTNYPAMDEHRSEHERVLRELTKLRNELERGEIKPVRDYVSQRLPKWFRLHVLSMDNPLAAHVQK